MDMQSKQILNIAIDLPEGERANLAASLIRSLDAAPDPEAGAAWAREIEQRILSIDDGSVELDSWDAVMSKLGSNLENQIVNH